MKDVKGFKVIYFTHYTELYGANKSLLNLVEGLRLKEDVEIMLIAPFEGKVTQQARELGVNYLIIPFRNEVRSGNSRAGLIRKIFGIVYNWLIVLRYSSLLKSDGRVIIHSNSSAMLIGAYFSYWLNLPHIWHIREFGWDDYKMIYDFGERYFEFWLQKTKFTIGISDSIYEKRLSHLNLENVSVINNGVVFEKKISERSERSIRGESEEAIFAIIGVIMPEKGQHEAVEAFNLIAKEYDCARLWVVGNGDDQAYYANMKARARELGLENKVMFTGFIDDMDKLYRQIDFLLVCSRHEALGRVTLEAMSYSVPVIGFDSSGTREIIKDGYNGLLYSGDFEELRKKMKFALDNSRIMEEIGKNGLAVVSERFTIEKYVNKIYDVYKGILSR